MCIRLIRNECQRMLEVIEDILLLSHAEARTAESADAVDVTALAHEVCTSLSNQAAQKNIALSVDGALTLRAVEKDVWEILYNLVSNAIRYGREGGYAKVQLSAEGLCVDDDGVGIAAEHIPHLFEKFYRVDEARGMTSGGTGLGLSIVKTIVDRCGGEIRIESEPGSGSRFIVSFDPKNIAQEVHS